MPFSIIPFLLLAIPIAEIGAFILIGGEMGVWWTLSLILITAIIGSILLRIQGFQIMNRMREVINAGQIPGKELVDGIMIMIAGVLLLTPGFITDTIGFFLFVPVVRTFIWKVVASRIEFINPGNFNRPREDYNSYQNSRDEDVVDLDPEDFKDMDTGKPSSQSPWNKEISDSKDS